MAIKDKIKEIREIRGMSQQTLADKCKLQPSAINHFEKGRRTPTIKNVRLLAEALDVSCDYLIREPKLSDLKDPVLMQFVKRRRQENHPEEADAACIISFLIHAYGGKDDDKLTLDAQELKKDINVLIHHWYEMVKDALIDRVRRFAKEMKNEKRIQSK